MNTNIETNKCLCLLTADCGQNF